MRTAGMSRKADAYAMAHQRKKNWLRVVTCLAAVVVFWTTYALILPAVTLESGVYCGLPEHTHSEECYARPLICGQEESEGHVHTDECYGEPVLVCGLEEHTHTDACYVDPNEGPAPAQMFSGEKNGVTVTVSAPEGAFPAGTKMALGKASREAVQAAADAVNADASSVQAVDISFVSDGQEIEPAAPISVKLKSALVAASENAVVVHVDDAAQAEVIRDAAVEDEAITFETDAFSVYAITNEQIIRYQFEFYTDNGRGTPKLTLTVKGGDELVRPATPDYTQVASGTDADGEDLYEYNAFEGWYIGGERDSESGLYEGGTLLSFGEVDADTLKEYYKRSVQAYPGDYSDVEYNSETGEVVKKGTATTDDSTLKIIKVHARYYTYYTVTFWANRAVTGQDEKIDVVVDTQKVRKGEALDISTMTADSGESDMVFDYWAIRTDNGDGTYTTTKYEGTTVTPTADMALYAVFVKCYSVVFNTNSDNTVAAPTTQYLKEGEKVSNPGELTRTGYTFKGWYTGTADGNGSITYDENEFDFTSTITADTTLFAKWEAAETTYTVIVWKQKVSDSVTQNDETNVEGDTEEEKKNAIAELREGRHYDYVESYTCVSMTGTDITESLVTDATVRTMDGFGPGAKETITEGVNFTTTDGFTTTATTSFTGFHYGWNDADTAAKLTGDGNTIINVYYDRDTITINFYYKYSNGSFVTTNGTGPNSSRYTNDTVTSCTHYATFTGLYGQPFSRYDYVWPKTITVNGTSEKVKWNLVKDDGGSYTTTTFLDSFIPSSGSNTINYLAGKQTNEIKIEYYKETVSAAQERAKAGAADYSAETFVYDADDWGDPANTAYGSGSSFNITDKYEGFVPCLYRYKKGTTSGSNFDNGPDHGDIGDNNDNDDDDVVFDEDGWSQWLPVTDGSSYVQVASYSAIQILCQRNIHTVTYQWNPDDTGHKDVYVPYGTELSKLDKPGTDIVTAREGYVIDKDEAGNINWYQDNMSFQKEADFSITMPDANLIAYAKSVPATLTVTYDPNGGTFTTNADSPVWTKDGDDGYWTENGVTYYKQSVGYNATATEPPTPNGPNADYTFQSWTYVGSDGKTVDWNFASNIPDNMTMTAKWHTSKTFTIQYGYMANDEFTQFDANEVGDSDTYAAGAQAVIKVYTDVQGTRKFVGWRLGNDTTLYNSGQTLAVNYEADVADGDADEVIKLIAVYEEVPQTSVVFNANGGKFTATGTDGSTTTSDTYMVTLDNNTSLDLDSIAAPTLANYRLVGWNTKDDGTGTTYTADGDKNTAEIFVTANLTEGETNTLYAVWAVSLDLTVKKVATENAETVLPGAEFVLYYTKDETDYYYNNGSWSELSETVTESGCALATDADGLIKFTGLGEGTYSLKEIKAPDGYKLLENAITVTVTSSATVTASGGANTGEVPVDGKTITVRNSTGVQLPATGGEGTYFYTTSGLLLLAGAVVYGCALRRKRERRTVD